MEEKKLVGLIVCHYLGYVSKLDSLDGIRCILDDLSEPTLKSIVKDLELEDKYGK